MTSRSELIEQFLREAERSGASVTAVIRDSEKVYDTIKTLIPDGTTGILAAPDHLDPALFDPLRQISGIRENPDDNTLESAWYGITDAFAGIARTGSVCVAVTDGLGGSASLFSERHIVLVDSTDIVYRPADLLQSDEITSGGYLNNMVMITGPSATADMGELVKGVHGPGELYIILLE